jgi:putative membrane protein
MSCAGSKKKTHPENSGNAARVCCIEWHASPNQPMETAMNKTLAPIAFALLAAGLLPSAHAANPNDAQIAAIVVAANTVDIDAGKLAESKTKSKEVRAFAKQMVADHSNVNKQAVALVKKLHVTPEENDTSKSLTQGGASMRDKLKGMSGAEFDKAYVDNEVGYHQAVLDAIDKTLIPSASNAELKALLGKVRPAIAAHLEHAKHIQATMK